MKIKHITAVLMALGTLSLFATGVGCREKSVAMQPADQTYTVHGIIDELPQRDETRPEIMIEHEAIDNFMNAQGEIVGMNSMPMKFPLAQGVSVEGLKAGDPVELTFEVRWKTNPRLQATTIEALPAGTQVTLGKAQAKPTDAAATTDTQAQ